VILAACRDPAATPPPSPSQTPAAETFRFSSLSAGTYHTCGIGMNGIAYCWGWNQYGQLGNGTTTNSNRPTPVSGSITFSSLMAAGYHTCGLTPDGAAYCWGDNVYGVLGDGTGSQRLSPVPVLGGLTYSSISGGMWHTCALTSTGVAYCWGENSHGELATGDFARHSSPFPIGGGLSFKRLAAGSGHTCAQSANDVWYCWGANLWGEVGNSGFDVNLPVAVTGGDKFVTVRGGGRLYAAGKPHYGHSCGLTADGAAFCWGYNGVGQLGNGAMDTDRHTTPIAIAPALTFAMVVAGYDFSCGLGRDESTYCWGNNARGRLGIGSSASGTAPTRLMVDFGFKTLTAGGHTCGLVLNNEAYCWGDNGEGQLGDGSNVDRTSPSLVVRP